MSGSELGSCRTLVDGTGMVSKHSSGPRDEDLNLDDLIKVTRHGFNQCLNLGQVFQYPTWNPTSQKEQHDPNTDPNILPRLKKQGLQL